MKKKTLAVLLAVSMTAGLAACGGGDSAPTADTGSGSAADDAADRDAAAAEDAMSDADTSEHVVITYMTTGDAPSGDALNTYNDMMEKLNAILTEKVNAELETYFISWTDYLANYNLTLAQMDGSVDLRNLLGLAGFLAERQERRVSGAVRGDAADLRAADLGKRAGRSLGTVQVRR